MGILVQTNSSLAASSGSAKERFQANWNNRKVEVISSGLSTTLLAGGTTAAALLGGPIFAIATLAAVTLLSLGVFLRSALTKPAAQPASKPASITPPVTAKAVAVQTTAPVTAPVKIGPTIQPEAPSIAQKVKNALSTVIPSFVQKHPIETAIGAALAAGASYGIYAGYKAFTAATAPSMALVPYISKGTCPIPPFTTTSFTIPNPFGFNPSKPVVTTINTTAVKETPSVTPAIATANTHTTAPTTIASRRAFTQKEIDALLSPVKVTSPMASSQSLPPFALNGLAASIYKSFSSRLSAAASPTLSQPIEIPSAPVPKFEKRGSTPPLFVDNSSAPIPSLKPQPAAETNANAPIPQKKFDHPASTLQPAKETLKTILEKLDEAYAALQACVTQPISNSSGTP